MALSATQVANLAIANQNAIGQYGSNRNNALTGNSIGTSNALGQMTNGYFNAMGQLGTAAGAYGAAGQAAAANTNRGNAVGGILGGLGGSGGGQYGSGNFNITGPGGFTATGGYNRGTAPTTPPSGGSTWQQPEQAQFDNNSMMNFFNSARTDMGSSGGFAGTARQNVYDTGRNTRGDIMSPDIMNGLNTNYNTGMDSLNQQDQRGYEDRTADRQQDDRQNQRYYNDRAQQWRFPTQQQPSPPAANPNLQARPGLRNLFGYRQGG